MPTPSTESGSIGPFLVIRLLRQVYAIRELPADLHIDVLIALAMSAREACQELQMCLVVGRERALYLYPDGTSEWSKVLPRPAEFVSFRPKALDFLPGAGQAPEEAPRPTAPPPTPPPPATRPLIASPPALYAGTPPSVANPSPSREPIDPRPMLGVMRWIILAGAAGRILLAHM